MPKTTTTRRKPAPKRESGSRYGSRLAFIMLAQLEASTDLCDACALDEMVQGRTQPQDNIVWRYLETCRARSRGAERGFCAVLSDFVADCSEGFVPDSETYEKALKIRAPAKRKSAETERVRTWKAVQRLTGNAAPMPADWMKK
jgi:hypothetical protein